MNTGLDIYTKDNLPTWKEIYDTWESKIFSFDPNTFTGDYTNDPYWLIPTPEYRIEMLANYLNYKLLRDGMDSLSYTLICPNQILGNDDEWDNDEEFPIEYIRFGVMKEKDLNDDEEFNNAMQFAVDPPVYCFLKAISDGFVSLVAFVQLKRDINLQVNGYITDTHQETLEKIIRPLINDVITYFENGVGWKDANGNLIPSEPTTGCNSGVDLAL